MKILKKIEHNKDKIFCSGVLIGLGVYLFYDVLTLDFGVRMETDLRAVVEGMEAVITTHIGVSYLRKSINLKNEENVCENEKSHNLKSKNNKEM